jgi:hypothetical protein
LDFAIGEKLVARSSTRLTLAPRGLEFVRKIEQDEEALTAEKDFFSRIGKKVTTLMIERVLVWNNLL